MIYALLHGKEEGKTTSCIIFSETICSDIPWWKYLPIYSERVNSGRNSWGHLYVKIRMFLL